MLLLTLLSKKSFSSCFTNCLEVVGFICKAVPSVLSTSKTLKENPPLCVCVQYRKIEFSKYLKTIVRGV